MNKVSRRLNVSQKQLES